MKKYINKINRKLVRLSEYVNCLIKHGIPCDKRTYLIGTPTHTNIGDSAITLAEKHILKRIYGEHRIKELTTNDYLKFKRVLPKYIPKNALLCCHGGGNIGNLWYHEELLRYQILKSFPDNPIIIFPQTVFFTNDNEGAEAIEESYSHYEGFQNLTIVAREKTSFNTLKSLYHNPQILLTPDIVLSTRMEDYGVKVNSRSGVLMVFRSDSEKAMSDDDRMAITEYLDEHKMEYKYTDMYSDEPVTKDNRMELVRKKMQEFADSELVITDRLHGMVFAAITGTPCIAFSNNHHKIEGTYEWISYLPYIKYVTDIKTGIDYICKLKEMKDCSFDNTPLLSLFNPLVKEIQRYVD